MTSLAVHNFVQMSNRLVYVAKRILVPSSLLLLTIMWSFMMDSFNFPLLATP